jgi:hypothetical protein
VPHCAAPTAASREGEWLQFAPLASAVLGAEFVRDSRVFRNASADIRRGWAL